MLKKVLLKALTNLTPEEKEEVRKSLGDGKTATEENVDEQKGKGAEKNNESAEATKEKEVVENADANIIEDNLSAGEENGKNEQSQDDVTSKTNSDPVQSGTVIEIAGEGNGVRVEDLVTQEMLTARLEALNAKLNAVIDENKALKDKYENPDFGNHIKKGAGTADDAKAQRAINETFEEYSKQFM